MLSSFGTKMLQRTQHIHGTPEGIYEGLFTLRTFSSFWLYRRTVWTEGYRPTQFHLHFFKNIVSKISLAQRAGNTWCSLSTFLVKYNRTGGLIWKTESNVGFLKANLDITDSWIHICFNCLFFLISMILGRSVYNDFSMMLWYLYEKGIHRFKDLWGKHHNH